jgi:hypothetical protein
MTRVKLAKLFLVFLLILLLSLLFIRIYGDWNTSQLINQQETKTILMAKFERPCNYSELLIWEHQHLNFTYDPITRYNNPIDILNYGKGRCGEFAVLYTALCIANGYDARLVDSIIGDHEWTQVKVNGTWLHVDPSLSQNDSRVFDTYMYERDWKTAPILALAFNGSTIEDVTNNYRQGFWINIASWQMLLILIIVLSSLFFVLTFSPIRRRLYQLSFQSKHKISRKIGQWYENNLHNIYITRLALTFLFPIAVGVLWFSNTDQGFLLNLLLIGVALLTASFVELPVLTKAHLFLSQIEDCLGEFKCTYKEGISCKARERKLVMLPGEDRIVLFRLQNLSLHTLKNCVVWFVFPRNFEIQKVSKQSTVDFGKPYSIQTRNNACMFNLEPSLSISPNDCAVFPIKLKLIRNGNDTDRITVQLSSESTWGTAEEHLKVDYIT